MADVRGVWLPKSQKADISFPSSCGTNRRIHHPTANSRLDDPESPVNTNRLPGTAPANFLEPHFWTATGTCLVTRLTGTLRNRTRSLDRRHAWEYTENRGDNRENRSDWRKWTYWIKTCSQASRAGARSGSGIPKIGRQLHYR